MSLKRKITLLVGAIMLLLLIIPIATVRIKIDLPPAPPVQPSQAKPVYITIDANGAIRVEGATSSLSTLADDVAARATTADKRQQRIMVKADDDLAYKDFNTILRRLRDSGWTKIEMPSKSLEAG